MELNAEDRKSVRKFTGDPVDAKTIREAIEFSKKAPSAGGLRSYHIMVVIGGKTIKKISEIAKQDWIAKAGTVLVICSDPGKSRERSPGLTQTFTLLAKDMALVGWGLLMKRG